MFKKIAALSAAAVLGAGLMTGCGATAATDTGYSAENPLVLTLAHGLSETHTVHIAMTQFAEEVNEKTNGRIQVKIFPNGQLGSDEGIEFVDGDDSGIIMDGGGDIDDFQEVTQPPHEEGSAPTEP